MSISASPLASVKCWPAYALLRREYLLQQLWGYDYDGFDRTVDTYITRLRKKLGAQAEKLVSVWGVEYRFLL